MNLQQFDYFAVEVLDSNSGLWNRGFLVDIIDRSFLVDFFVTDEEHRLVPFDEAWMPAETERYEEPVLGSDIEVLVQVSEHDPLTWLPATTLHSEKDTNLVYAKLITRENIICCVQGNCWTRKNTKREKVQHDTFSKNALLVSHARFGQLEEHSFSVLWHDAMKGTKIIRIDGNCVHFLVRDRTARVGRGNSYHFISSQGTVATGGVMDGLDSHLGCNWDVPRSKDYPLFWHGEKIRKFVGLEDSGHIMTEQSIFHFGNVDRPGSWKDRKGAGKSVIYTVPDELLQITFRYLDAIDQRIFRRVCSRWNFVLCTTALESTKIFSLSRFQSAWLGEPSFISYQFIYAVFRLISPAVRQVIIRGDFLNYAPKLEKLLVAVDHSAASVKTHLDLLTISDVECIVFQMPDREDPSREGRSPRRIKRIRLVNICLAPFFDGFWFGGVEIRVRLAQLDGTDNKTLSECILALLDRHCPDYSPSERTRMKMAVVDSAEGTLQWLFHVLLSFGFETTYHASDLDFSAARPYALRALHAALAHRLVSHYRSQYKEADRT